MLKLEMYLVSLYENKCIEHTWVPYILFTNDHNCLMLKIRWTPSILSPYPKLCISRIVAFHLAVFTLIFYASMMCMDVFHHMPHIFGRVLQISSKKKNMLNLEFRPRPAVLLNSFSSLWTPLNSVNTCIIFPVMVQLSSSDMKVH